jgi:hypothetical protein
LSTRTEIVAVRNVLSGMTAPPSWSAFAHHDA